MYSHYRQSARYKDLIFNIPYEKFLELSQQDCHYDASPPSNICKSKHNKEDFIYNGLDRIDSSKGYTLDNVVPCCAKCNRAKLDMSPEEFLDWRRRIANKLRLDFLRDEL